MAWDGWNDTNIAELKRLREVEGLSYGIIAKRLGCSRNAAISKGDRLDLRMGIPSDPGAASLRRLPQVRREKPAPARAPVLKIGAGNQVYTSHSVAAPRKLRTVGVEVGSVPLLSLRGCKYPTGETPDGEHLFCNRPKNPEAPYCKEHAAIAYQAPQPARKRDPAANTSNRDRLTSDLRNWRTA